MIHAGLRWKSVTAAARRASSGTTWMALAPEPTTATWRPVEFGRVVPARRVEDRTGERLEAGDGGDPRLAQAPAREDEDLGLDARPGARRRTAGASVAASGIPLRVDERRVEASVDASSRSRSTTRSRYAWISAPGRELGRPVRLGMPREAVEVRRHVARDAGVGVVAPRAADAVGALEDRDLVPARRAAPSRRRARRSPAPTIATSTDAAGHRDTSR